MPELINVMPGSPEWLAARRAGVTATDIVTILGLSRYDSVYSLFWRKLGQVPDPPGRDRWELGKTLEPYITKRFEEVYDGLVWGGGLFRSSSRSWQMATPDRVTGLTGPAGFTGVLELKSWADAGRAAWGIPAPLYAGRVGDDGEHLDPEPPFPPDRGRVPVAVRAQVLWQMDVMDVAAGHVGVVFLPSGEFRSYTIEHFGEREGPFRFHADCDVCDDQQLMRNAGEEFMARLRLELPPPDPDSSAATLAAVRARFSRQLAKQAEIDPDLWQAYTDHKTAIDGITELMRAREIELREQAGEAAEYTVDGQVVARRVIVDAQVKAHVRHQDYIRRIKQGDDSE